MNDSFTQRYFTEFYSQLESVSVLTNKAIKIFQEVWDRGGSFTEEQYGEVSIAIAPVKNCCNEYISARYIKHVPSYGDTSDNGKAKFR